MVEKNVQKASISRLSGQMLFSTRVYPRQNLRKIVTQSKYKKERSG